MVGLLPPSTGGVVQLEGPQEVGGVLEVGSDCQDLVDQILHADDSHLAKLGLNDVIGGDGGTVTINLTTNRNLKGIIRKRIFMKRKV